MYCEYAEFVMFQLVVGIMRTQAILFQVNFEKSLLKYTLSNYCIFLRKTVEMLIDTGKSKVWNRPWIYTFSRHRWNLKPQTPKRWNIHPPSLPWLDQWNFPPYWNPPPPTVPSDETFKPLPSDRWNFNGTVLYCTASLIYNCLKVVTFERPWLTGASYLKQY
jgi:hypothetical protein